MASAPRPVRGQVVVVTGGARGIGRATAAALVARGARVALGDIDGELAEQVARELGDGAVGLELDVTSRSSFDAFLDTVERLLGPLDVLINGAGIMPVGAFVEEDDALTARALAINAGGAMLGCKLALARMLARGGGRILNIAPLPGPAGFAHASHLAAAGAVRAFTHALRAELAGTGVSVRLVLVGPTRTEMLAGIRQPRTQRAGSADAVADTICRALEGGRSVLTSPGLLAWSVRLALTRMLPRRWRTRSPDLAARLPYQARIAPPPTAPPTTAPPTAAPPTTAPRRGQAERVRSAADSVAEVVRRHDRRR